MKASEQSLAPDVGSVALGNSLIGTDGLTSLTMTVILSEVEGISSIKTTTTS